MGGQNAQSELRVSLVHKTKFQVGLKCYECHSVAVTGFAGGESGSAKAKGKNFKKRR